MNVEKYVRVIEGYIRLGGRTQDTQIIKHLVFKTPDSSELEEAARFYLRAFNVSDMSKTGDLVRLWKLFIEGNISYFIVTKYNDRIIGCGAVVPYHSLAWIAWMAVDPDIQGKGVGNEIMKNLMDYTKDSGFETLRLDATNIGRKLYSKFGFRDEYRVLWYEITSQGISNKFDGVDITISNVIPNWCLKLDKEAFGDDRSQLLKHLLDNGGQIITVENGGYGILWKNRIGPIIAEDVGIARNIVKYAYKLK